MGVRKETISPGDGKDFSPQVLLYNIFGKFVHPSYNTLCFEYAGSTFPKTGQTVVVHYTGKLCNSTQCNNE